MSEFEKMIKDMNCPLCYQNSDFELSYTLRVGNYEYRDYRCSSCNREPGLNSIRIYNRETSESENAKNFLLEESRKENEKELKEKIASKPGRARR